LIVGVVVGSGGGSGDRKQKAAAAVKPPARAVAKARGLSLRRQIGEILMISFRGTSAPSYVRQALRAGRASGVILFRANALNPATTTALTRSLQRAGRGRVLIATDQEGGSIRILPWAAPTVSEGATTSPSQAKAQAQQAARDLRAVGINVTLAPVADVGGPGSVMVGRAFPGGASAVTAFTKAAVAGYRGTRVAATLKHFPGLGEATTNTDDETVAISSPAAALRTRDLPPFQAGIDAGAPIVMASHALFKGFDPANIASQSKPILTGLLRNKMRFKGVVITDSMEAAAVLKRSSLEIAALRSVSAGADLLLLTGAGSFPRVSNQLLVAAKRSARFRARIAEAAARVIALKRSLGLSAG
jgi:beta-N-acetylhexosaminidase